ncbi:MAG: nitroreductase family protein [Acidobacteria bacterium]|nr:nitroreductase family protein [Acidobacteriota bacterium]MBE3131441.1 nitroreductase family protein [Acidobacteriota bacterium]
MTEERAAAEVTAFQKILRGRRSIRRYLPGPVDPDKVRACLEAARLAPSAHNAQPWRFVVVDDPELKDRLTSAAFSGIYSGSKFAALAPIIIVLLARLDRVANRIGARLQGVPFHFLDMGIAGEHIVLQAEELGLATCWMGWFNYRKVRKVLDIPRTYKVVAMMPLGYAEKRPNREPPRKTFEEVVTFNGIERD